MNGPTPDVPIQDIFALYRRATTLLGMYHAFVPEYVGYFTENCLLCSYWICFCSGELEFPISAFFEPYVRQWLINTDDKTKNWVEAVCFHDLIILIF